jgi:hypothetical protein
MRATVSSYIALLSIEPMMSKIDARLSIQWVILVHVKWVIY